MFINSYPVPVKNPLLQTNQEGAGEYILCFFAPITDGTVHADINKILINSTSFDFKTDGTVDGHHKFSSTAPSLYPLSNGVKFSDFEIPAGYQACYYNTGIPFSQEDNEIRFNITLEDKYGFKTSSSISNKAKKLSEPKIVELDDNDIQSGESYTADADTKIYTIKIFHDGTYDDGEPFAGTAKIYYKIEENSGKTPFGGTGILTGSANGSVTLNLERGKYIISAYAQKNYCVDSDENTVTNVTLKEIPVYYVAPDGTCGSEGDNGSISKPFKRFADVMDNLQYADTFNNHVCKIYLKNNATNYYFNSGETYMLEVPSDEADCNTFEISGYGGIKTINLSKYENKAVLSVQSGTDVTFKDINITGGKMASNSDDHSIIKNEGTLNLENCSITNNDCTGVVSNNAITIRNCTVTGNKKGGVEATGTINLSGKVVISGNTAEDASDPSKTVNCNLSLLKKSTDDDKISSVEGLSSSSKIWITKQTTPGTGDPKVLVESWPVGLGNPWDIFKSDSSDFFVDYPSDSDKTKVVLKKQGATVTVGGQESIEFNEVTSGSGAVSCAYKVEKEISIKSWTLTCGSDLVLSTEYTVTLDSSNKKVIITTGSLQPGKYILTLNFEYNGNPYEVKLPVTKN